MRGAAELCDNEIHKTVYTQVSWQLPDLYSVQVILLALNGVFGSSGFFQLEEHNHLESIKDKFSSSLCK